MRGQETVGKLKLNHFQVTTHLVDGVPVRCIKATGVQLHMKKRNKRKRSSENSYEFFMLEMPNEDSCPYRSFVLYKSKANMTLLPSNPSVFLNSEGCKSTKEFWYKKQFGQRTNRNIFKDIHKMIMKTSPFYNAENPLVWEKPYTNHSIRVTSRVTKPNFLLPLIYSLYRVLHVSTFILICNDFFVQSTANL